MIASNDRFMRLFDMKIFIKIGFFGNMFSNIQQNTANRKTFDLMWKDNLVSKHIWYGILPGMAGRPCEDSGRKNPNVMNP